MSRHIQLICSVLILVWMTVTHAQDCISEREPNDAPASATPVGEQSCLAGQLQATDQDFFLWTLAAGHAGGSFWRFELQGGYDNLTKAVLYRADRRGDNITPVRLYQLDAENGSTARTGPLLLTPGDYLFGVTKGGNDGAYTLQFQPDAGLPATGDVEPNDRADQATAIEDEFDLSGDLAGSVDHYRWTISESGAKGLWQLRLQYALGPAVRLRIYDGQQNVLVERGGNNDGIVELPDLQLDAGAYDIELSPQATASLPYVLQASARQAAAGGRELEPNDSLKTAFPLEASLAVRGILAGADKDVFSFEVTGAPMLWRVTVLAKDKPVTALRSYNGGGTLEQQVRAGSDRTTRLDNLLLLPGRHFIEVEGEDTSYILKLAPIGPVDLTQKADSMTGAEGDRPPGLLELEPNDTEDRANPLRAGTPRVGTLPQAEDRDVYGFHLGAEQPVRITLTPPVNGQLTLHLAAGSGAGPTAGSPKPGESAVYEGQLRTGDYTLTVQSQGLAEGYYQVLLEQLDPLQVVAGEALPVPVSVSSEKPVVAAYRKESQRLALTVDLQNTGTQAETISLKAVSSDRGWTPQPAPDSSTLDPGARKQVTVTLGVAPDARDDQPVRITLLASNPNGRGNTASLTLEAECDAPLSEPAQYWALPAAMLGGFNVAWTGLGAKVHGDNPFAAELFDGLTVPVMDTPRLKTGDTVTVELAGDAPVTLAGTLLNPLGRSLRRMDDELKDFAVLVSIDGEHYEPVLSGQLDTALEEQAFVFETPVEARFARLQLLSSAGMAAGASAVPVTLGEWKLVAAPGENPLQIPLNLADPAVGGYLVWADPAPEVRDALLAGASASTAIRTGEDQTDATWVVGFLHDRAAQLGGLQWAHPAAAQAGSIAGVDVAVSLESPVGPWLPLGTLSAAGGGTAPASMKLEKPAWARFVRFHATGLAPKTLYPLPGTLRIFERSPADDYRSILAEWGQYSRPAIYEMSVAAPAGTALAENETNDTQSDAQPLPAGQWLAGSVLLGQDTDWYRIEVPAEHNTLRLALRGDPLVSYAYELNDADGHAVATRAETGAEGMTVSATVTPGIYFLRLYEPPRSVVLSWDTSASLSGYSKFILATAARFAAGVEPGAESVNLLPYGNPSKFLLPDWADQPFEVMVAVNNFDPGRLFSSNSEEALLVASKALGGRPGARAVIMMTDADSNGYSSTPELWRSLAGSRPRVFTLQAPSSEHSSLQAERSQRLMESWADVGGGQYDYARTVGNFDTGVARATCQLRRPKQYRILAGTFFAEPPGTGGIRVLGGEKPLANTLGDKAIEIILDASGSMQKRIEGQPRYQIAKQVLGSLIQDTLPEGTPFALRVFGNREAKSCRTDLEVPFGPLDARAVQDVIKLVEPKQLGGTPIAASLQQVPNDLRAAAGDKIVVLITDGEESCDGDVEAAIDALRAQHIDVQLNVIGFDFDASDRQAARQQFQQWASMGGGRYYDTRSATELASAIGAAISPGFEVIDTAGAVIATGSVGGEEVSVAAGRYTVRVLSNPPVEFQDVEVGKDKTVELTLE